MQGSPSDRPTRRDLDPAALGLIERHGAEIMLTARRYAATPDDAEDAFQRAFEILLTHAPTTDEAELVPWLKTVVKHEAFALRRAGERHSPVTHDGRPVERPTAAAVTHEHAESRERGLQGAEALARLKPEEVRALVLKARGLTYREIGELNQWSYTKTNRLLTEGRRAFRLRLAGIHAGAECERVEPLLSAMADGEANADQIATLRPHLKTCLTCRVRLKEFRSTPSDVAALAPHGAAAAAGTGGGRLRTAVESVLGLAQHKAALLGERAHAIAEVATGQKIAAVAASAAALAGGGAAADELATHPDPRPVADVQPQERPPAEPVKDEVAISPVPPDESSSTSSPDSGDDAGATAAAPAATPQPEPDPANEFDPSAAAQVQPAPAAAQVQPAPAPQQASAPQSAAPLAGSSPGAVTPGGAPPGPSPPGGGEFAP